MAKSKQRLKQKKLAFARAAGQSEGPGDSANKGTSIPLSDGADASPRWVIWCRRLAAALLGGLVIYVAYFPSDSILVEGGDALWFSAMSLVIWTMTMATEPIVRGASGNDRSSTSTLWGDGLAIDLLVWGLAVWMVLTALATCPPGNPRQATNEAWLWVAGAAVLSAGRRLLSGRASRTMIISLLAAVATGMAVHALHQEWISLPRTRAEYLADPDAVLRAAGIDAPRNSARRMVFANRLLDGGPTATFALANSLAAVLTVAVLVPVGLLRSWRYRKRPVWVHACLVVLALVGVSALFATRSRSALIACTLGIAWIWMRRSSSPTTRSPLTSTRWFTATIVALGIGGAIFVGLAFWGDDEWMSSAPSSLAFRLQYWKSTLALLVDHPLMGAGPGGFQAMYLRYRLPEANETIADPHNFFFETLAAGGVIAGSLLIFLSVACFRAGQKSDRDAALGDSDSEAPGSNSIAPWIGYGAGISLSLVWLFESLSGRLPDFEAAIFAVPIAIAAGWFLHRELENSEPENSEPENSAMLGAAQSEPRFICTAILFAVMTHLMFSGGWTVPGVAIVVWLVVGSICRAGNVRSSQSGSTLKAVTDNPATDSGERGRRMAPKLGLAVLGVGGALLFCLRSESIVPVQEAHLALSRAEDSARSGALTLVDSESLRATEADRWSYEAPRWRSEFLKSRLVDQGDELMTRESWGEALETAIDRAGANPLLWRAAGEQSLHLYQRFGRTDDLQQSDRLISMALVGNPTDVSLTAQAALIAIERSNTEQAMILAKEAARLSKLGGNIVRDLGLQQVYVVEKIGVAARRQPVLQSIKDQFRRRLGLSNEPVDSPQRSTETVKSVKPVE